MTHKKTETPMPNAHLHELLVDGLRDILSAEQQLLKALKKLAKAADRQELQEAFENHYAQTESQIERLKDVFSSLGLSPRAKKCLAMEGLLKEADEIMEEFAENPEVMDAALIAAAQKVEHYEIASYGCLVIYAKLMEHEQEKEILGGILNEEKQTDELLTELAMNNANTPATK